MEKHLSKQYFSSCLFAFYAKSNPISFCLFCLDLKIDQLKLILLLKEPQSNSALLNTILSLNLSITNFIITTTITIIAIITSFTIIILFKINFY